jgi:transcriptional regulator with XRE-family HTH domain
MSTHIAGHPRSQSFDGALLLAYYVGQRRQKLNLSLEEAARLAGLAVSEWQALERGWLPDAPGTLRAIAATLELPAKDIKDLVDFSRSHQKPGGPFTHK